MGAPGALGPMGTSGAAGGNGAQYVKILKKVEMAEKFEKISFFDQNLFFYFQTRLKWSETIKKTNQELLKHGLGPIFMNSTPKMSENWRFFAIFPTSKGDYSEYMEWGWKGLL